MTTARARGVDSPFGHWLRNTRELDSIEARLSVSDVDWSFEKYMPNVDGIGTREVQLMMDVEVKGFLAEVGPAQLEQLFYRHQFLNQKKQLKRPGGRPPARVWNFGQCVLQFEKAVPQEGTRMAWGVFLECGALKWYRTTKLSSIIHVLRFDVWPDNPEARLSLRRHHKSHKEIVVERCPLGFEVNRELRWSS